MPTISNAEFGRRIQSLQWAMLIINVFVIAIGGCIFGLAVVTRPVLRITHNDYHSQMQSICDVMVSTGLVQIIVAGYDIFAACWKLIRLIYLAITVACIGVILEMVGIALIIYIQADADAFVANDVYRQWFVWECLPNHSHSCSIRMSHYITWFMLPQVVLSAICIVLHGLSILYLVKLIRTLREKQNHIWKAKELRQLSPHAFSRGLGSDMASKMENNNLIPNMEEEEDDDTSSDVTPSSILKHEHGYVPAAGTSLDNDYDDAGVVRNRLNPKDPQSLTFNTNVEIHLFNPQESEEGHNTTQM